MLQIYYAGQAVGLIVADTLDHARAGAQAVEITYTNQQPPITNIDDAIAAGQVASGKRVALLANSSKTGIRFITPLTFKKLLPNF